MSHEVVYGHVRVGSPFGARLVHALERLRGWFARAPEPRIEGRIEIEREARSVTVEALLEGRRWDVRM